MVKLTPDQIAGILKAVREADEAIMAIYDDPDSLEVTTKPDGTPVTQADIAANEILTGGLKTLLPEIPVLSEEGDRNENLGLLARDRFWLIDPLDGTKTFIAGKTGHFTVCLALIEGHSPTFGVISAPALGETYFGGKEYGSFKNSGEGGRISLGDTAGRAAGIVLTSRGGFNRATEEYIENHYPDHERQTAGSQLKFTRIAEGLADAYPRIGGHLCTWDIGAGQAILEGVGGKIIRPDGSRIDYRAENMKAGDFVASRF